MIVLVLCRRTMQKMTSWEYWIVTMASTVLAFNSGLEAKISAQCANLLGCLKQGLHSHRFIVCKYVI